jgi:hypothetical protein
MIIKIFAFFLCATYILAQPTFITAETNDSLLEVSIESSRAEYIKGELIDVFIKIKNISSDTLKISPLTQYLYSYESDSTIQKFTSTHSHYSGNSITPFDEFLNMIDPLKWIFYKDLEWALPSFPWYYWT